MGNALTEDVRALWLSIRASGAWWTVHELVHHWRPTFTEWEVQQYLEALVTGGYIQARDAGFGGSPNLPQYCVTSDCHPLPGDAFATV